MKENIANRVGRIISGSLNALVDAVENAAPETVMEEAIREIDGAIDEVRAELGRVVGSKHLANQRLMEENQKHEDLSEKIELAVAEERDDLAEAAIAAQLDIEAQMPVLESTVSECGDQEKELEGYISALQARKREMKDDLKSFRETRGETESVAAGGSGSSGASVAAKVSKAESAYDRVVENASGLIGRSGMGDPESAAKLSELDDMARNNRVNERLEKIKQRRATEK
ncbi:MAG: PspA/IM30 family protein [Gammaproteobacteria bacterium]|nr:PspA/IM30 family protein [Gammaproteobacteria bacterium]